MTEIKLTKRYPQSRTEDIVDAYIRGWNDALDAVQNGKFHIAEQTEPQICETCRHWKYIAKEWQCEAYKCQGYEPKTEPSGCWVKENQGKQICDDCIKSTDCSWK